MIIINYIKSDLKIIKIPTQVTGSDIDILKKELALNNGFKEIVFDLSNAVYVNDSFISYLQLVKIEKPGLSNRIVLLNPSETVFKTLEHGNIPKIYKIQYIHSTAW
jgi:hypothetical protein